MISLPTPRAPVTTCRPGSKKRWPRAAFAHRASVCTPPTQPLDACAKPSPPSSASHSSRTTKSRVKHKRGTSPQHETASSSRSRMPSLVSASGMQRASAAPSEVYIMLYTLVVVLLVLWALGLATSYTLGGVLHLLLVAALVLLAVQLITGRRTV